MTLEEILKDIQDNPIKEVDYITKDMIVMLKRDLEKLSKITNNCIDKGIPIGIEDTKYYKWSSEANKYILNKEYILEHLEK